MASSPVVIRLPRTAYLIVVFLLVGSVPLAFGASNSPGVQDSALLADVGGVSISPLALVLVIPVLVAFFIARTATIVSEDGLRVRALFGTRDLPWASLRGLSISGRAIYAVLPDGAVRLPCVRIAHLGPISRLSNGRLPELADATPKPAPQRRRRR